MKCEICKEEYESLKGLHSHITRKHSRSQEDYYNEFYPRLDKFSNIPIVYKNYNQYFSSDFNDRESFSNWVLDNCRNPETLDYCIDKIIQRCSDKGDNSLPGNVSLKSLMLPSIIWLDKLCNGLSNLKARLGEKNISLRYNYDKKLIFDNDSLLKIYIDTREQLPLNFNTVTERMGLNIGDYTAADPFFANVFIERKSLSDLFSTLSQGVERFEREIKKAVDLNAYLVVVVDSLYSEAINYKPNGRFQQKVDGSNIFYQIRRLSDIYKDNLQFVFSGSRNRSSNLITRIFRLKGLVREIDLEYCKDIGIL